MPTTFVKGDFLEETPLNHATRAFAFGADVSGTMDTGIAHAMKRRWPTLAEAWHERCAGGRMQLGDAFAWREGDVVVYALGIQRGGGKPKISWVERALQSMVSQATQAGLTRISLPRLWGAASGLDGARVKRVLDAVGETSPVSLVVFEQFIRAKPHGASPAGAAELEEEPAAQAGEEEASLVVESPVKAKRKAGTARKTKTKTPAKAKTNAKATTKGPAKGKPKPKSKTSTTSKPKSKATTKRSK